MQFKPSGYIEIPEARKRLWLTKYPDDEEGLRARADGKLPERYYEASRHLHEVEQPLLAPLVAGELKAIMLDRRGNKLEVPAEYWECDGARVVTLERGELETTSSSRRDWREFNGRPCFLDEQHFAALFSNGTSPAGAAVVSKTRGKRTDQRRGKALGDYWEHLLSLFKHWRDHTPGVFNDGGSQKSARRLAKEVRTAWRIRTRPLPQSPLPLPSLPRSESALRNAVAKALKLVDELAPQ
jgi:hypothetical protein